MVEVVAVVRVAVDEGVAAVEMVVVGAPVEGKSVGV